MKKLLFKNLATTRVLRYIVYLLIFLVLASVAIWYLNRDIDKVPPIQHQNLSAPPLNSQITLAANINLQELEDILNDALPNPINKIKGKKKDCKFKIDCWYKGTVQMRKLAEIYSTGENLSFDIPLSVKYSAGPTNRYLGFTRYIVQSENRTASFTVTATSSPKLNSDWSLTLDLDTNNIKWNKRPTIKLLYLFTISIDGVVEPVIRRELKKIKRVIESKINDIDIKNSAITIWKKAHTPIKLSDDPEVWLRLKPTDIHFSGIHAHNDIIAASVSLHTEMETTLGQRPKAFPTSDFPKLDKQVQESGNSLIRLPVVLEYKAMKKEIEKILKVGQQWAPFQDKPTHYLTVQAVNVYPSEHDLVVGIDFIIASPNKLLNTSGTVYFLGKPVIDNNQQVKFDSFDFTRTTDNTFINVVSVFLRGTIKSKLLALSNNYLKGAYEKIQRAATDELSKDFTDGVTSRVTLSYANVDRILMLKQGIYLSVLSEGTWRLNLSPLGY